MNNVLSDKTILFSRYFAGIVFLFLGFLLTFKNIFSGIFMVLFGISLLPILYKKMDFKKFKYAQIILPSVFIAISGICFVVYNLPKEESVKVQSEANSIFEESKEDDEYQNDKKVEITELNFSDSEIELDVNDTKNIILEIFPTDAAAVNENLECYTSDNKIATLEKIDTDNTENEFEFEIKPYREGECELFVKSASGIESNKVHIKIIDNKKIQEEKNEIKESEEKQIPEKVQSKEEKTTNKNVKEKTKIESSGSSNTSDNKNVSDTNPGKSSNKNSDKKNNYNKENGVYRTPHGKRYHYDPNCGGKNSYKITAEEAEKDGLTPCKKCVR